MPDALLISDDYLPRPRFKKLLIAANIQHAEQLRALYWDEEYAKEFEVLSLRNSSPLVYVTYPGEALTGRRFSSLEIPDRVLNELKRDPTGLMLDWYNEIALTRIVSGGEVRVTG